MTRRDFHLLFHASVLVALVLTWAWQQAGFLLWLLLLIVTPVWAWRVRRSAQPQAPAPRAWVRAAYLTSAVAMAVIWLGAAVLMVLLVSLMNPWPVSLYQHHAVKRHLLETGFIPAGATDVVVRADHGGFHGDGRQVVIFDYGSLPLDQLQPISNLQRNAAARGMTLRWQDMPFDERARATLRTLDHFAIAPGLWPDAKSSATRYWCDDSADFRPYHCGHLYILDADAKRFWYINVTD